MSLFSNSNLEKLKSQVITLESRLERLEWKLEIALNQIVHTPSQENIGRPVEFKREAYLGPTRDELQKEELSKHAKDGKWTSRHCRQGWMQLDDTERSLTLEAIISYDDPITNNELLVLTGSDLEIVRKETSGLYSRGLLKRRLNQNSNFTDRYEYIAAPAAHRLLKKRDHQRRLSNGKKR